MLILLKPVRFTCKKSRLARDTAYRVGGVFFPGTFSSHETLTVALPERGAGAGNER